MPSQTNIASFVLRFVHETATDGMADPSHADWHGVIKHVQTNNERHFSCFAEAIAFIAKYVTLDESVSIVRTE